MARSASQAQSESLSDSARPLESVTVIVDTHTHRGVPVKAGSTIQVTAEEKELLIKNNAIEVQP